MNWLVRVSTLGVLTMTTCINAVQYGSETAVSVEPARTFPNTDNDNKMLGFGWFKNGFTLADNTTTCDFDSAYPVSGTVAFNGGTVTLLQDLTFSNLTTLSSFGDIVGNDHVLDLCSSIASLGTGDHTLTDVTLCLHADLTLSGTLRIAGDCTICAEGHAIILGSGGELVVESGASLTVQDARIQQVSGTNVRCADDTASITLKNMTWQQSGDATFSNGYFTFEGDVTFTGPYTFAYESAAQSTVATNALWGVSDGLTLSIGRAQLGGTDPILLTDDTSGLCFHTGNLHVTQYGLQVLKGVVQVSKDVSFDVVATTSTEGLIFGDGTADSTIQMSLLPDAKLTLAGGAVVFNTQNDTFFKSINASARVIRPSGQIVHVQQDFTFDSVSIEFDPTSITYVTAGTATTFDKAYIDGAAGQFLVKGSRVDATTMRLDGNDYTSILLGSYPGITQISGTGNQFLGVGRITGPIIFIDPAGQLIVQGKLTAEHLVSLAGGTLTLAGDFSLGLDKTITGPGTVDLGSYIFSLGGKPSTWVTPLTFTGDNATIEMHNDMTLTKTLSFDGTCQINGNGNVLDLGSTGALEILDNAELRLRNLKVIGISGERIACLTSTGKLALEDVTWIQSDDATFSTGKLEFEGKVDFLGDYVFAYTSDQTSVVGSNSEWHLSDGIQLHIGRASVGGNEPVYFTDVSSRIHFDQSTFHITTHGMQLDHGTFCTSRDVTIEMESTDTTNGLILGDGTSPDLVFLINPGTRVEFIDGHVVYDVSDVNSIFSRSTTSWLVRTGSNLLHVAKPMVLSNISIKADLATVITSEPNATIDFTDCQIALPGGVIMATARRVTNFIHLLDGNDSTYVQYGNYPIYTQIAGTGNELAGTGCITGQVIFTDASAQLNYGLLGQMLNHIYLNGGKLTLAGDLNFGLDYRIASGGTIDLATHRLVLGAKKQVWDQDILIESTNGEVDLNAHVDLSATITIDGVCTINGNGNILNMDTTGEIVVTDGSTLTLKDIRIEDVSGTQIRLLGDTSHLILENMEWLQDDDFTFATGKMTFRGQVDFSGPYTFDYTSDQTSTIDVNSEWHLKDGLILNIGRATAGGDEPLHMTDLSARLHFDKATYHITQHGMQIGCGTFCTSRDVTVEMESTNTTNGLMLGTGQQEDPIQFVVNPGSTVDFDGGHVVYNVYDATATRSQSTTAMLKRSGTNVLHLMTNMTTQNISIESGPLTTISFEENETLSYDNCYIILSTGIFEISGVRYNFYTQLLAGNQSIFMHQGILPAYTLAAGPGNRLEGSGIISGGIILQDSNAVLTMALDGLVTNDITLNGGTLVIEQDLQLSCKKKIDGNGTVDLSGNAVVLGIKDASWNGDITWQCEGGAIELNADLDLSGAWTFDGNAVIRGSDHVLDLGTTGSLIIAAGGSLRLKDLTVKNIVTGNIRCEDDTATLILDNVHWIQNGDYEFDRGVLQIKSLARMGGEHSFVYTTDQECTIEDYSTLQLEQGFTFEYNPLGCDPTLLAFQDATSQLVVHDGELKCTTTGGLQLIKGTLVVHDEMRLSSTIAQLSEFQEIDTGITLGDQVQADDFAVKIGTGSELRLLCGSLNYKNVGDVFCTANKHACLHVGELSTLRLYDSLTIGLGYVQFDDNTVLLRSSGKQLLGDVIVSGELSYGSIPA